MLLFEKARQIGFIGIGLSQKFGTSHPQRFIHLDTKPSKALWSCQIAGNAITGLMTASVIARIGSNI